MAENIKIVTTLAIIFNAFGGLHGGLYGGLRFPSNYYNTGGYRTGAVIPAAVQSRHTITFKEVKVPTNHIDTPVVEVQAHETPLYLQFKTYSSPVHASQTHYSGPPQALVKTVSADEPNYLYHLVNKPVYQEIREIIVPYRRIKQEIRPVVEQVNTVVAQSGTDGGDKKSAVSSSVADNSHKDNYNPDYNYNGHVGYQVSGPVGIGYASTYKMRGSDIRPYSFDYGGVAGVSHHNSAANENAQTYDSGRYTTDGSNHYNNGDSTANENEQTYDSNRYTTEGGDHYNNLDNYDNSANSVEDLQFSGVAANDGADAHNNVGQYYEPVVSGNYGYNYDLNYINDGILRVYKD